jgi:membrane protein
VLSSYVMSASRGVVSSLPESVRLMFDSIEFLLLAVGLAGLYHYVPNTPVRWRHALAGGVFVAVCMELAKRVLALYLSSVPTYSIIYGAFATLPILLIWIYVAWTIVLLGAVIAAYLPLVMSGVSRKQDQHGWQFSLALEVLQQLAQARMQPHKGFSAKALSQRLRVEGLQLEPVLQELAQLDWVGAVATSSAAMADSAGDVRYILLVAPEEVPLAPLVERLLVTAEPSVQPLLAKWGIPSATLADALVSV